MTDAAANQVRKRGDISIMNHQSSSAKSRRLFLAMAPVFFVPAAVLAQAGSPFVGKWKGDVPGVGGAEITVLAVHSDGRVEGSMRFGDQGQVQPFGERVDVSRGISGGTVSGSTLAIETSTGGSYQFNLAGNEMSGTYRRGTTYNVPVSFKRT